MKRNKKKKESEEVSLEKLVPYLKNFDFTKPMFILALDQSTTFTGFIGGIMDFSSPEYCEDMGDNEIVYVPRLVWLERKHIFNLPSHKYGAAMTPFPVGLPRIEDFEDHLKLIIRDYEKILFETYPNDFYFLWKNKSFVTESVFCSMPSNTIPLARFQTLAMNVGRNEEFVPFEYVNASAKSSIGAAGSKDNVTLCVNQIFNTNIEDTEENGHLSDAIALLYHHVQVLAKFHNRKK